jgi:NDP-sugar pyrophosphorylase family protein
MIEFIKNYGLEGQAVILAGGRGNRMGDITDNKQKCMLEVKGRPIIDHILAGLNNVFGKGMEVIIATGYCGGEVKKYFGDNYQGMKITYVHDDRPLETKNRLMLAKDILVKPFLFLAGDILTPTSILEKEIEFFYKEQSKNSDKLLGVLGGAKDCGPAPTHAILTINDRSLLRDISYPYLKKYEGDGLRDVHRAIYSLDFLEKMQYSEEKVLSRAIQTIVSRGESAKFGVVEFDGPWGHYAEPNDLETYRDLPFLRS